MLNKINKELNAMLKGGINQNRLENIKSLKLENIGVFKVVNEMIDTLYLSQNYVDLLQLSRLLRSIELVQKEISINEEEKKLYLLEKTLNNQNKIYLAKNRNTNISLRYNERSIKSFVNKVFQMEYIGQETLLGNHAFYKELTEAFEKAYLVDNKIVVLHFWFKDDYARYLLNNYNFKTKGNRAGDFLNYIAIYFESEAAQKAKTLMDTNNNKLYKAALEIIGLDKQNENVLLNILNSYKKKDGTFKALNGTYYSALIGLYYTNSKQYESFFQLLDQNHKRKVFYRQISFLNYKYNIDKLGCNLYCDNYRAIDLINAMNSVINISRIDTSISYEKLNEIIIGNSEMTIIQTLSKYKDSYGGEINKINAVFYELYIKFYKKEDPKELLAKSMLLDNEISQKFDCIQVNIQNMIPLFNYTKYEGDSYEISFLNDLLDVYYNKIQLNFEKIMLIENNANLSIFYYNRNLTEVFDDSLIIKDEAKDSLIKNIQLLKVINQELGNKNFLQKVDEKTIEELTKLKNKKEDFSKFNCAEIGKLINLEVINFTGVNCYNYETINKLKKLKKMNIRILKNDGILDILLELPMIEKVYVISNVWNLEVDETLIYELIKKENLKEIRIDFWGKSYYWKKGRKNIEIEDKLKRNNHNKKKKKGVNTNQKIVEKKNLLLKKVYSIFSR